MNQITMILMNQLKIKRPEIYKVVNQAKQNNGDPVEFFNQVTEKYTPEQLELLFDKARGFGIPEETISRLQKK